jgi:choline dehydrogenase-like flavoprotein
LSGLRVVDASNIPEVRSTVTNLTVTVLAERIAHGSYASGSTEPAAVSN